MIENTNSLLANTTAMDQDEISLFDFLQVIVDNLQLLVLGPLACGIVAFCISFAIPPIYTAKTLFLPPQQQQSTAASLLASLGALGGMAGAGASIKSPADQYLSFIKSMSVQDAIVERFKLTEKYDSKFKSDARTVLNEKVRITYGKDGLISVEVDDTDPKFAADLANAHVEELQSLLGRMAVTEAQHRRIFFEKQLQITKNNLAKAELALKSSGTNSSVLKASPTSAFESVARIKAGISVQEVKLSSMRNYLTEAAPEFKQALNELASLKIHLAKAEHEEPAVKETNDYLSRYREFKYQETMFELFAKQFELAKVDESREGFGIQVLDVAQPPERKSKPKKSLIATVANLISFLILILIVISRKVIENACKDDAINLRIQTIKKSFYKAVGKGA